MQRWNAKRRGIPFRLTYEEWLEVWQQSGHLPHRGKGNGKYCMARYADKGAYKVSNVHIITHNQNSKDYVAPPHVRYAMGSASRGKPHSEVWKQRISAAHKGKVVSDETRRRMSIAARNRRT